MPAPVRVAKEGLDTDGGVRFTEFPSWGRAEALPNQTVTPKPLVAQKPVHVCVLGQIQLREIFFESLELNK